MSYLVLARKYRPQTFSEIVGQEHVVRTLSNAFAQDRVHHAFLFCGPRGVGKTTAARVLGKALNCEKGASATPCGECSACTSIASGTAVDYYEMDGASNRGIDAIRDLTEAVRYQPAALRKKVYVIDEVHMLTTEAFNALLKTLEEPPPHVCFVLATTEPHKLPGTILSRCQRYDFKLVPAARLAEHVGSVFSAESIAIDPAAITLVVRESGGSVRDAMSICDQVISFVGDGRITETAVADVLGLADRALTLAIYDALVEGDAKTALAAAASAADRGIGEVQLARALVQLLRDLSVVQVTGAGTGLVDGSTDEIAELHERARHRAGGRIRQMFERMLRACDELGTTQQPRLVLDLALIDLAAIEPLVPLGDLLDRLSDMERRLGGDGGSPRPSRSRQVVRRAPDAPRRASRDAASDEPPAIDAPPAADEPHPFAPPSSAPAPSRPAPAASPAVSPPAAPPNPAPAVRSATGGHPVDPSAWAGVITALEDQRKISLVGMFQEAKLLECSGSTISVAFAADSIYAEMAAERAKQDEMRDFLAEFFGRAIDFSIRLLSDSELAKAGPSAQSLVERSENERRAQRDVLENEVREHPITRTVLETFGARIKEIKTDV